MSKRTRYKYQVANQLGTTLTKTEDYSLTEANIIEDGNQFIKLTTGNIKLTLPAASENLKGIIVRVFTSNQGYVYVAAGFGGGGGNYDTVNIGRYETVDFWCDGSYWYALTTAVTGTGSSSSSSTITLRLEQ